MGIVFGTSWWCTASYTWAFYEQKATEVRRITKQQELSHRCLSHFGVPTYRVDYHLYGKQRQAYASQVNLARSITKRKAVKTMPDFRSSSGSGRAPITTRTKQSWLHLSQTIKLRTGTNHLKHLPLFFPFLIRPAKHECQVVSNDSWMDGQVRHVL